MYLNKSLNVIISDIEFNHNMEICKFINEITNCIVQNIHRTSF